MAFLTWSASSLLWTVPDVSISGYALPYIYSRLSLPLYLGAVMSASFFSYVHSPAIQFTVVEAEKGPAHPLTPMSVLLFWFLARAVVLWIFI